MLGNNPIRPPKKGDGNSLDVQHIFATIQGEGPYAGMPAIFIRLGGCNLACTFCDTEFETFRPLAIAAILDEVRALAAANPVSLIVITGGEPMRQPIARLCEMLIAAGFKVQIETNGLLWRQLPPEVEIVCSPKNNGEGYFLIRPDMLARINAFKFLISAHRPEYQDVGDVGQGEAPIYVQPMDEHDDVRNRENLALAVSLARSRNYRLSLQLHKIMGME